MPGSRIDYSNILPLTGDFRKNATKSPFYKPVKLAATVHADLDVLLWLKGQGKGYQTRVNVIPRDATLRAVHQKTWAVAHPGARWPPARRLKRWQVDNR